MTVKTMERRICHHAAAIAAIQKRAEGDEAEKIVGYAAVFYDGTPETEYKLWDDFYERILPGAFDDAIRNDDCRALFNHDANQVLGRTTAGTLRLSVDARGLKYEIDPPETSAGRDVLALLRRRDVTGSSFGFEIFEQVFREVDHLTIREIVKVKLWDVGPVTYPAYTGTDSDVAKRSAQAWRQSRPRPRLEAAKKLLG